MQLIPASLIAGITLFRLGALSVLTQVIELADVQSTTY